MKFHIHVEWVTDDGVHHAYARDGGFLLLWRTIRMVVPIGARVSVDSVREKKHEPDTTQ